MKGHAAALTAGLSEPLARQLRRDIILAMARRRGVLRITRGLAHHLGVSRKQLTAEITAQIDNEAPLAWRSRRVLYHTSGQTHISLDLTDDALVTLVAALRHAREGSPTRSQLGEAAHLLHRIGADLPYDQFRKLSALGQFETITVLVAEDGRPVTAIRNMVATAIRAERKLQILYTATGGARTERVIWPLTLTHHDMCVVGWCESRNDFRTFRIDSIGAPVLTDCPFPKRREALLTEWRKHLPKRDGGDTVNIHPDG